MALQRADIVLVAALLTPAHAAIYTAATRFLILGQLGTTAIQQVLQPQLAGLFARADLDGVRSVFTAATAWLMALAWPIYLVGVTTAGWWLQIFGDSYTAGQSVVMVLGLSMLFATACGPVDVVLLMAGKSTLSLLNNLIALVINLALNLLLIPLWGILGAATAWAAALGVRNLLPVIQVYRHYRMTAFTTPVAWVAGSAACCFGLVPAVLVNLPGPSLLLVTVWLPLGCAVYAALGWRGRTLLSLDAFLPARQRADQNNPAPSGPGPNHPTEPSHQPPTPSHSAAVAGAPKESL